MSEKILEIKQRADEALRLLGLTGSREQGKRLIMAGQALVRLPGEGAARLIQKPGQLLPGGAALSLKEAERFVSRGGYKLLTAIEAFGLNIGGKVCLDAGASTGGFTDCLLQHGAARVYAVDVGTAQLDQRLRADARVISLEKTNLRYAPPELIPEPVDLVTADVSFISLTLVLPACLHFLRCPGLLICLIKPQFELEPREVKGGVVRDVALQQKAVDKIVNFCVESLGLRHAGTTPARIKGPKGNQEYLAVFRRD